MEEGETGGWGISDTPEEDELDLHDERIGDGGGTGRTDDVGDARELRRRSSGFSSSGIFGLEHTSGVDTRQSDNVDLEDDGRRKSDGRTTTKKPSPDKSPPQSRLHGILSPTFRQSPTITDVNHITDQIPRRPSRSETKTDQTRSTLDGATERTPLLPHSGSDPPGADPAYGSGGRRRSSISKTKTRRHSVHLSRNESGLSNTSRAGLGESTDGQTVSFQPPLTLGREVNRSSHIVKLFNAVAVLVGIGLLSLTLAFAHAGWICGTLMLVGFAALTCHT